MLDEDRFDPDTVEVRAAGGVVWRLVDDRLEVVIVHRPHRQDWSLPKGKVDPGETIEQTARREVAEETGLECVLGAPLGTTHYFDSKQRSKIVWYFAMQQSSGSFAVNDEVDEILWLPLDEAAAQVSYESDRTVLLRFGQRLAAS